MDRHLFLSIFLALTAAHFIADIPLNPAWLGRAKRRSRGARRLWFLAGHCCIVAIVSYLLILGWRSPDLLLIAAVVGICHLLVDCARLWIEPRVYGDDAPAIPRGTILSGRGDGDWWHRNRRRWWAVNIGDQAAHLACIAAIVWLFPFHP